MHLGSPLDELLDVGVGSQTPVLSKAGWSALLTAKQCSGTSVSLLGRFNL